MLKKDSVIIKTNPFNHLTNSETQAVTRAAQRYGDFLQLSTVMDWMQACPDSGFSAW
jgi:hypothetical protein